MPNDFNIFIPLQKTGNGQLTGIASTTSVDRDGERMSDKALKMMVNDIKTAGVNLFGNHEHSWENTLGRITDADLVNNEVQIKIDLDDPTTNPKIPMLLNKMKRGIKLGLSVGGGVKMKKGNTLDEVVIYEVSVVGIPSNADSFLTLPQAIAKSARHMPAISLKNRKCALCLSEIQKSQCPICHHQN